MMASGLLAGALLMPGAALAGAALPSSPTAAIHVGKRALDLVGAIAMTQLPTHLLLPPLTKDILSCPIGSPISIQVSQAYVDVSPKSLSFTPADGALGIAAVLDMDGFAHVVIANGYGCLADAACDVSFAAQGLAPSAQLSISVTDGMPTSSIGDVSITVPDGQLHVSFANCILDNLSSGVVDAVSQELLKLGQGPIGSALGQQVPPILDAQLGSMLTQSGGVAGYGFSAAVTDVKMTAHGIDAYAEIGVGYEGPQAVCLPPPDASMPTTRNPTPVDGQLALPSTMTSSVVLGISPGLITDALTAAWQSGLLCTDDDAMKKLGFDPSNLAALVPGLPAGLALHFTMGLDTAPTIDTDNGGAIHMHVKGAELLLALTAAGQDPAGIAVSTDFSVGVTPTVDATTGTIYAALTGMTMEHLEMHAGATGTAITVDPERLSVLMSDVVMPMAAQKLQGMPLSPAAFGAMGVYAWLADLKTNDSGIYVGAEAFRPDPTVLDQGLPDTQLQKTPGKLVRAGLVRYQVSGTDDVTPYQLLRYEYQVDSGPISAPAFGGVVQAAVTTGGSHVFQVRSIDLAGNHANNWMTHSFEVDAVAPTLTITRQPDVTLRATSAHIQFTGTDDRSAGAQLSYGYRVEARAPDQSAMQLVTAVQPTGLGAATGEIVVDNLANGSVYQVTVLLYDEAGNVTSQQIGFGVADANGCSMAPGPQGTLGSLLLVLCALFLATRRRVALSR